MRARRLNDRVDIIKATPSKNEEGRPITVDKVVNTIYCEHLKTTIKEFKDYVGEGRSTALNLLVRYQQRIEIKSEMKVKFHNKVYKIVRIEPNHADKDFTLLGCELIE